MSDASEATAMSAANDFDVSFSMLSRTLSSLPAVNMKKASTSKKVGNKTLNSYNRKGLHGLGRKINGTGKKLFKSKASRKKKAKPRGGDPRFVSVDAPASDVVNSNDHRNATLQEMHRASAAGWRTSEVGIVKVKAKKGYREKRGRERGAPQGVWEDDIALRE